PPPPSAAFLRLLETIANRMRMSPIDQPLMLMELLARRRTSPTGSWKAHGGPGSPSTASPAA
ncbi:MAG: hypothetical protein WCK64_14325, partial [Synechococcaceae cyanobacterium ELA445]